MGRYTNKIYWLDWQQKNSANNENDTVTGLISSPSGTMQFVDSSISRIQNGSYIWNINPGKVRVVGVIYNLGIIVSGSNPRNYLSTYNPSGSKYSLGFNNMYGGLNAVGIAANGNITNFDIQLTLQVFNGTSWIDVKTPGIVMADAESLTDIPNGQQQNPTGFGTGKFEYLSATIPDQKDNGIGWELADYNRGDNQATSSTYTIAFYHPTETNGGDSLRLLAYINGSSI